MQDFFILYARVLEITFDPFLALFRMSFIILAIIDFYLFPIAALFFAMELDFQVRGIQSLINPNLNMYLSIYFFTRTI